MFTKWRKVLKPYLDLFIILNLILTAMIVQYLVYLEIRIQHVAAILQSFGEIFQE